MPRRLPFLPRLVVAVPRPRRSNPAALPSRERRRRSAPLPPGPYRVPISTIDWLVSRESPAARYVALRDLMGRPAKDPELKKARRAVPRDPWTRDVLEVLRHRTRPGTALPELMRKYDGGAWLTLFLAETGCDVSIPLVRHAGDLLLAVWEKAFVELSRHAEAPVDVVAFTAACRALALMGHAEDARLLAASGYVAREALLGRTQSAKALLLFATIPEERRSPLVLQAAEFLRARVLEVEIPREGTLAGRRDFLDGGFPNGEETDLVELLYALALTTPAGALDPRQVPLAPCLSLLLARADHRGRWKLERAPLHGLPYPLERTGELSRWVTIRALTAVQRFLGLTIESVPKSPRRVAR